MGEDARALGIGGERAASGVAGDDLAAAAAHGEERAAAAGLGRGGVVGADPRGRVVERVDRQCHTVQDSAQSSRVVAYNVTYRNPDGTTGTMRTDSKPGNRIALGTQDKTVGYDVTYRYDGVERTVRMDRDPGDRLPVIDGQVVLQTASAGSPGRG